jgi:HPt (histidine-containing phosphotransfer) domain-containing protein
MPTGPWVLPDELRLLAEADENLVNEVLSVFRTDTAERFAKLKAALAQDDRTTVRNHAHAMKGSSGQVGAFEVATFCRQIEAEAINGPPETLKDLIARAEAAFAEVLQAMLK